MKTLVALVLTFLLACHSHEAGHAHDHEEGGSAAEPEPIALTRWTERYELFVELPPPVNGKPIAYHAHVTRLSNFYAVREGRFVVRYKRADGSVVREHAQVGAKRPGIFVFEGEGLPTGEYATEMAYEHEGAADTWDCGLIEVLAAEPPPAPESADTSITFLKETQWKIAFRTAWSEEREVRQQLEMTAVVEPAGDDQLSLGAPTSGRFLHDPKRVLAVGTRVSKGDTLGSIVPNVADEDYAKLLFAADEAAIAKKQNDEEIERIKPLVKDGALPAKRLVLLENEAELLASRARLAQQRLGALSGVGRGLPVKAGMDGVISELLVRNGESVEPGATLVRLGGSTRLWVRAKTFSRGPFDQAGPSALRVGISDPLDLSARSARFLTPTPVIDPETRVGTWLLDLGDAPLPAAVRPGATAVVTARVGAAETSVVVPQGAVVEIDTRPFVFVQIDGEHFEKRAVVVGPQDAGYIPILRGVAKGERVVTLGGFDIHLAAVMGTVESHRH